MANPKFAKLQAIIRSYKKVLVAFSGGSDSAFVLKVSRDVLGRENVLAVIAKSPSLPERELKEAREIAVALDSSLMEIETDEINNPQYKANPVNRCYFCKSELYSRLAPIAEKNNFQFVLNGTNQDDLGDWRPGLKAADENGVKSPLVEAGFTKQEIRDVSKNIGLSTWSKPQAACLSSRIPFGTSISPEKLKQVERAEDLLKDLGFQVVRLRSLEAKAVIEVGSSETNHFFQNSEIREKTLSALKDIGFQTIDLNLKGYQPGRFNPGLSLRGNVPNDAEAIQEPRLLRRANRSVPDDQAANRRWIDRRRASGPPRNDGRGLNRPER